MPDLLTPALQWWTSLTLPLSWPLTLSISLFVALIVLGLYHVGFRVLTRVTEATTTRVDDLLLRRSRLPARALIVLITLHTGLFLRDSTHPGLHKAVLLIELMLIAYLVIETFETLLLDYWMEERKQIQVPAVLRHLLLVVLYGVAILSILGTVTGMSVVPVLATSSVVTVVLGLALQETLGNLFAGLALHAEQPFNQGDWLLVDGIEGRVIYQGWRSTRVRTFSGDVVVIPNATIARTRLQNFSAPDRRTSRLIEWPVKLSASPHEVEQAFHEALSQVSVIQKDPAPKIWLVGMNALQQRYVVKFWLTDFELHDDAESDLFKALWKCSQAHGIALETTTIPGISAEDGEPGLMRQRRGGEGGQNS